MRRIPGLFLAIFMLFATHVPLCSQERSAREWDDLLDRYERICKMCLELKVDAGADVPAERMNTLLGELDNLKSEFGKVGDLMPAAARLRYEAIREMYSSGIVADTKVPVVPVLPRLMAVPPAFTAPSAPANPYEPHPACIAYSWTVYASALVLPEFSAGLGGSYMRGNYGVYAAVRSNFSNHRPSYSALSDGTSISGPVWVSGRTAVDRIIVNAGPVFRLTRNLSAYLGLGYGMRRLCWEDSEGLWLEVSDASNKGLCTELGVSCSFGRFVLSAGWLSLPFSYNALTVAAGWSFGPYKFP